MDFIQYLDYLIITGLLIVLSVYLTRWEPPIKKQYIALVLFISGALLSFFMVSNWAYGVLIAGLVYYKEELVNEVKVIKNSFNGVKNELDNKGIEK